MPTLASDQLARKAGIARKGPIVLLFYPFEVESHSLHVSRKNTPSSKA